MSPEVFRRPLIAAAVMAGAGMYALTGCSSEATNPAPEASAMNVDVSTTLPLEAAQDLIASGVTEGPVSAQKDAALRTVGEVPDVVAKQVTAEDVDAARQTVSSLENEAIRACGLTAIDTHLAKTTIYASSEFSAYATVESNRQKVAVAEAVVDLIADPSMRVQAENSLDYQEAQVAVDAATGYTPKSEIAEALFASVEDPGIKELAQRAVGGDKEAKKQLGDQTSESERSMQKLDSDAWNCLYFGSNSQARSLNSGIADFNAARALHGE